MGEVTEDGNEIRGRSENRQRGVGGGHEGSRRGKNLKMWGVGRGRAESSRGKMERGRMEQKLEKGKGENGLKKTKS